MGKTTVLFQKAVSALCYSYIREVCQTPPRIPFPDNRVVAFVLDEISRMPDHLRLPLKLFTLLFDFLALPLLRSPFHRRHHLGRWRWIESWRASPIGPCRDLMRFYEGLVVFCWYSDAFDWRDRQ